MHNAFDRYIQRLLDYISSQGQRPPAAPEATDAEFNHLALELFRLQCEHNATYARFCSARHHTPETVRSWRQIPAMPSVAFKEFELTCLPPDQRTHHFLSSGTSARKLGRHFHSASSLAVYEASLLPWFMEHLLPDEPDSLRPIALTPSPAHAPHSSLVYMLGVVARQLPRLAFTGTMIQDGSWALDINQTLTLLNRAIALTAPVLLLGTAFSIVHLLDEMQVRGLRLKLPFESGIMETGGYKGRSRKLPQSELHREITHRLGVPAKSIVREFGMSELSSQAYDHVAGRGSDIASPAQPAVFHFPDWARATVVSPEDGREVDEGATGLLQVIDLANVASVLAVRTEDLALRIGRGFELRGRASDAEPRGCSLMSAELP